MATNTLLSLLDSEQDWLNSGVCGEGGKECVPFVLKLCMCMPICVVYNYVYL